MSIGGIWVGDETYVINHVLPVPYVGRCPPLIYLAGNYSIELDRRGIPSRRAMGRSVPRRGGNRAMCSPPGITVCPPLFSPVTNYWSDMWIIDELMWWGGCGLVSERWRSRERGYKRTSLMT